MEEKKALEELHKEAKEQNSQFQMNDAVERIMSQVSMPKDNVQAAIESGADITLVKELWILQQEYERAQSIKAFNAAMADFKASEVKIEKSATARTKLKTGGWSERKYADLADVCTVLGPAMAKHGLSYGWGTDQADGAVKVTCVISHRDGHSISTTLSGLPDDTGYKNRIQAIGSTVEYLKRYTLLALSGVPTQGMDTDGGMAHDEPESGGGGTLNDSQVGSLKNLANATGKRLGCEITLDRIAKAQGVEKIELANYNAAIKQIKEWRA